MNQAAGRQFDISEKITGNWCKVARALWLMKPAKKASQEKPWLSEFEDCLHMAAAASTHIFLALCGEEILDTFL